MPSVVTRSATWRLGRAGLGLRCPGSVGKDNENHRVTRRQKARAAVTPRGARALRVSEALTSGSFSPSGWQSTHFPQLTGEKRGLRAEPPHVALSSLHSASASCHAA